LQLAAERAEVHTQQQTQPAGTTDDVAQLVAAKQSCKELSKSIRQAEKDAASAQKQADLLTTQKAHLDASIDEKTKQLATFTTEQVRRRACFTSACCSAALCAMQLCEAARHCTCGMTRAYFANRNSIRRQLTRCALQEYTETHLSELRGKLDTATAEKKAAKEQKEAANNALDNVAVQQEAVGAQREALFKKQNLNAKFATQVRASGRAVSCCAAACLCGCHLLVVASRCDAPAL
jgi:hypothetical protein